MFLPFSWNANIIWNANLWLFLLTNLFCDIWRTSSPQDNFVVHRLFCEKSIRQVMISYRPCSRSMELLCNNLITQILRSKRDAVWTELNFACVSVIVFVDESFLFNLKNFIPTRVKKIWLKKWRNSQRNQQIRSRT